MCDWGNLELLPYRFLGLLGYGFILELYKDSYAIAKHESGLSRIQRHHLMP
jgi:hypothetical protein